MIETFVSKMFDMIHADPCKTCIVKIMCEEHPMKVYDCEYYKKYRKKKSKIRDIGSTYDGFILVVIILIGFIFILATIGLGFYQWYEIIRYLILK